MAEEAYELESGNPGDPGVWKFCPTCGGAWSAAHECQQRGDVLVQKKRGRRTELWSTVWFTLAIMGILFLGMIVSAYGVDRGDSDAIFWVLESCQLLMLVVTVAWGAVRWRRSMKWFRLPRARYWAFAVVGGFATYGLAMLSMLVTKAMFGEAVFDAEPLMFEGIGFVTAVLTVAVMPALAEEMAFRGVMIDGFKRELGFRDTAIVTALLFMLVHFQVFSFFHLVAMGLGAAYLRRCSGSLLPSMLMHFVHNFLVVAVFYGGGG